MARKFHFRLDTVRRLRKQVVDRQRRVVADAQRVATAADEANAGRTRDLDHELHGARSELQTGTLDLTLLRSRQLFRAWLKRKVLETRADARAARAELDRERARLGEAAKRLKVIEKLRQRQWQRHRVAARRTEQAAYDDVAVQRYVRGRMQGETADTWH